eukprot:TRINITY_DN982_c0_g1_i2.p1 TRINITY_DN982_c0_g1~~TRINITY_DN982_c0_g1_i2.p1  ORF type:complete len:635 (-),score=144.52 TRINITY_DN982_c0_g1_i2:176-2080(-)
MAFHGRSARCGGQSIVWRLSATAIALACCTNGATGLVAGPALPLRHGNVRTQLLQAPRVLGCGLSARTAGQLTASLSSPNRFVGRRLASLRQRANSWRRSTKRVPAGSVDSYLDSLSQPAGQGRSSGGAGILGALRQLHWGKDLKQDWSNRLPYYKDDWKAGLTGKSVAAVLFLYFACLLPAVAFGGIAFQVTAGSLGVIEYLLACGVSGMTYAVFSGQPMTFIGPTGLTLAFMTALYGFTSAMSLPFLPVYSWCGVWTSGYMLLLAMGGASNLIRYATQFTDDVFNALLAVNFLFEASRSLFRNFQDGYNKSGAFLALNLALLTYTTTRKTVAARNSRYFNEEIREFLSDSGPVIVIVAMSLLTQVPALSSMGIEFLSVPSKFMLCGSRPWLSPMLSVPLNVRMACAVPAVLLTSLFFLDQNISSRVVNSPKHNMKKPPAYHQDLLVLGLITGVLSVLGLPWQCAATVQSLNHVRAMSTAEIIDSPDGSKEEVIKDVVETRVTGFSIHALILASVGMLPVLKRIPMPVVSGIFLYLGRKVMSGNEFLLRIKELCADQSLLKPNSSVKKVGYKTALGYTSVQLGMLGLLWTLKSFRQTALFFPSVIGLLVLVRLAVLPKLFSKDALDELDSAVA